MVLLFTHLVNAFIHLLFHSLIHTAINFNHSVPGIMWNVQILHTLFSFSHNIPARYDLLLKFVHGHKAQRARLTKGTYNRGEPEFKLKPIDATQELTHDSIKGL